MILGMNHCSHAQLPHGNHDIQNLPVPQFHRIIRHVQLDARHTAFPVKKRKLFIHDLLGGIGQDQMDTIVTRASTLRERSIVVEDRDDAIVVLVLQGKGHDGGCPAADGAARSSLPGIAGRGVPLLEVDVRVYASGRDVCAFRIND